MRTQVRVVTSTLLGLAIGASAAPAAAQSQPPNFVIISCDDLGYGDLGAFGHPTIRTPSLDRMATEGQRWTNFYTASAVCTPSRAALLTGRLPIRSGLYGNIKRVLNPSSTRGMPASEWTIAEALSSADYSTTCIGKWHLGHEIQHLPHNHGFDSFFGIPYSNDMSPVVSTLQAYLNPQIHYWDIPLQRNETVIERPADQRTITKRYTDEAVGFIQTNADRPFFLYLAHTMPHVPLFRSQQFIDSSERGVYGDVVEELDASVGRILDTLRTHELDDRTLVVFTSDNGPWTLFGPQGGSSGLLRGGKGETFEGGMRVPTICWWPGTIEPGVVTELGSAMDLLPSFCSLAGIQLPPTLTLDGFDLSDVWRQNAPSPRQTVFFYRGSRLYAVRHGPFKAHLLTRSGYGPDPIIAHDPPLLFHLGHDPSEQYNIASQHPVELAAIRSVIHRHVVGRVIAPSVLDY